MLILTNNPKVRRSYPEVTWIEGDPIEVMTQCKIRVQEGYRLFAHPLMGDIRLLRNPYRTVILGEKRQEIDLPSVQWIEQSLEKLHQVFRPLPGPWDGKDYEDIDFDLVQNVLGQGEIMEIFDERSSLHG